ncbi:Deubiquitinase MYSM1, partial [Trichinella spiralis]
FPVESSPIEETMSGKHRQGCIYGYGQPHQHIDLMPVSSIRRSERIPYMFRCSQQIHEVEWSLAYRLYIWIWATTSTYRSYAGKFYPAFKVDSVHVTLQPTDSRGGLELGLPVT